MTSRYRTTLCLAILVCVGSSWCLRGEADEASAKSPEEAEAFFTQRVHPVLAARCYKCHGAEKQEGGLRLDSRDAVLKGGESGEPAAVAGNANQSRLVRAVRHDGDVQMPPDSKIPDEEINLLVAWVNSGLSWSKSVAAVKSLSMAELTERERQTQWSLQPVRRPKLPEVHDTGWAATGVDRFILAQLEAAGLSHSRPADRRTQIRRLSFDLLGLPPTMQEVEAFIADTSPDAYDRVVDRILSSPRYGERWGRHWLDVARYADTRGYAFGKERRYPYAYTYRDYVVAALNDDKPYDNFVVEQLAADLLPSRDDKTYLAAMGFLTTGRKFNNQHDDFDDQIDVVCRGLLGLTVACARCHDHKYDAVPMADYYALYGVFASSSEPDDLPLIADPKLTVGYEAFQKELGKLREELEKYRGEKHAELVEEARRKATEYLVRILELKPDEMIERPMFTSLGARDLKPRLLERWRVYLKRRSTGDDPVFGPWQALTTLTDDQFAARSTEFLAKCKEQTAGSGTGNVNPKIKEKLLAQPPTSRAEVAKLYGSLLIEAYDQYVAAGGREESLAKLPEDVRSLVQVLVDKDSPTAIPRDELSGFLTRKDREQHRELQKKIDAFQAASPAAPPRAMVLKENSSPFSPRIFLRGNASRPGDPTTRQFLSLVAGKDRKPFVQGSGRLELAREIINPQNPLTRRVIANRVWLHHFGQSLIRTPSDLGIRCEPPLQLDLLDYLASRLLDDGWSLKELHREIVLSSTYRQESRNAGPTQVGAPSSTLNAQPSTLSTVDPENRMYWRMNRQRLEFEPLRDSLLAVANKLDLSMGGRSVDLMTSPATKRRTLYGYIDRQDLPNLLRVFDFASPDQSQAERPRTTVPQQALFLMNAPFVLEQAQAVAARSEIASASEPLAKIAALYRLLFQRDPTASEMEIDRQFVEQAAQSSTAEKSPTAWEQLAQILLLTNEFSYVD